MSENNVYIEGAIRPASEEANRGVALLNLGCRVNRVELDVMASELARAGFSLVEDKNAAVVVVNTCAVTAEAESKTRKAIRRLASLPQAPLVVATGCVANLFADELRSLAPNVLVEADKERVASLVLSELGIFSDAVGDAGELLATPTPTGRTRPGVKIQDGCDNRCTFCIVWKARGAARSVDSRRIKELVDDALVHGAEEVVLTGINLGTWSWFDGGQERRLPWLLEYLLNTTKVGRLRLSSIEPPDVTPELCEVMATYAPRIAPFLHVCLQSGSDSVLKAMARPYTADDFSRVVSNARATVPDLVVGTDLIVGFPHETDEDFAASLAMMEEQRIARAHVFRYSRRPGTPAAEMPGQVPAAVMATRAAQARSCSARIRFEEASLRVGTNDLVVVERPGRGVTGGLFDARLTAEVAVGTLLPVQIIGASPDAILQVEPLGSVS